LERLNLSPGRRKVLKLETFLIVLMISLLPSISIFLFSNQWKVMQAEKLLKNNPIVFNNITNFDYESLPNQVQMLKLSFQKKATDLEIANNSIRTYVTDSFKSFFFVKYILTQLINNPNQVYVTKIIYDGTTFYVDFYEYGIETKVSTSTIYNELSKFYNNVSVNLVEERNFISNIKYYRYSLGGMK